ncbi:hypothetical protein Tsubulata_035547 [Turnera subulata]|uniref:F-box domain-containing protein n=1 Tax=Turnera subulata TaxID=218843 RepID=A0A9Q0G7U1_9ROSI|nr:hypothetical protein Tsubulata_035547 [Turnera subulata]
MENKKGKQVKIEQGSVDRLSELPEEILLRILSFLRDGETLVRTSLLSKQWENLWRFFVPDLSFDSHADPAESGGGECFHSTVSTALEQLRHVPKIGKFEFTVHVDRTWPPNKNLLGDRVVDFALSRYVDHLVFNYICTNNPHSEPYNPWSNIPRFDALLTCTSLKSLLVGGCYLSDLARHPTLTSLTLERCIISYSHRNFAAMFPNLNTLCLRRCEYPNHCDGITMGRSLVDLTLECDSFLYVEISAPGLKYFRYFFGKFKRFIWFPRVIFPSLEEAEVHALEQVNYEDQEQDIILGGPEGLSFFKLLQGLGNAESVTLSSTIIQALLSFPENLENQPSPFNNRLKHLVVKAPSHEGKGSGFLEIPDNVMNYLLGGRTDVLTFHVSEFEMTMDALKGISACSTLIHNVARTNTRSSNLSTRAATPRKILLFLSSQIVHKVAQPMMNHQERLQLTGDKKVHWLKNSSKEPGQHHETPHQMQILDHNSHGTLQWSIRWSQHWRNLWRFPAAESVSFQLSPQPWSSF